VETQGLLWSPLSGRRSSAGIGQENGGAAQRSRPEATIAVPWW